MKELQGKRADFGSRVQGYVISGEIGEATGAGSSCSHCIQSESRDAGAQSTFSGFQPR